MNTSNNNLWQTYLENFQPEESLPHQFEEDFWANYETEIRASFKQRREIMPPPLPLQANVVENVSLDPLKDLRAIYDKQWKYPFSTRYLHNEAEVQKQELLKKNRGLATNVSVILGLIFLVANAFLLLIITIIAGIAYVHGFARGELVTKKEEVYFFNPLYLIFRQLKNNRLTQETNIYYRDIQAVQHNNGVLTVTTKLHQATFKMRIPNSVDGFPEVQDFLQQVAHYNQRLIASKKK